jgi:hypothetical protein
MSVSISIDMYIDMEMNADMDVDMDIQDLNVEHRILDRKCNLISEIMSDSSLFSLMSKVSIMLLILISFITDIKCSAHLCLQKGSYTPTLQPGPENHYGGVKISSSTSSVCTVFVFYRLCLQSESLHFAMFSSSKLYTSVSASMPHKKSR